MKKQLLLTLMLLLVAASSFAVEVEIGGLWYEVVSKVKGAKVIRYKNDNYYSGNIVIPSTVEYNGDNYSVTSIRKSAFYECSGLTSVTIPNSVTSIGESAFSGCSGLTSVTIPNSVTSIEWSAFSGCSSLTSITIPNSVTSIGSYAFYECSGLTSVTIPNSVTSIGISTFSDCSGLTSITIPNSVTSIESDAFTGCSSLTSINVEEGNTKYDSRDNCNAIIETSSNTLIVGCKNSTIPNSVTSIEWNAFSRCSSLTSITIPNSVTSIGNYAFSRCSSLTSITIPNSVTSIGNYAFSGCSSLTSINVEEGNTKYDSRDNCNAIIETSSNTLIAGCKNSTIPNSVTSIEGRAFYDCSGLTSITIPNSVTSIGWDAFYGCRGLTSITIPNSVTYIYYSAFFGCSGLTSVTILCESIGCWFDGLTSIQEINIGNGVTSIGNSAFYGCSGLTSVTIPNSVTSIGSNAFYGCSGLTSVTFGNSVTSIGESAFSGCRGLTSVTIPNSVTSIGDGAFYDCGSLTSVTFGNSVTSIGGSAFYGCSGLTSVTIPNSVTSIGSNAFIDCTNLLTVNSEIAEPFNCSGVFSEETQRKGVLNVPAGTKDLYIRFDGWREFLKIEEVGSAEPQQYLLSFVVDNKELSAKKVDEGATITPPTKDNNGNAISWYTYPTTMPAHDLVVYGMVPKPEAAAKYTITYVLDGQTYRTVIVEEGASVSKEKAPYKEGYTFNGWQNEPTTMPGHDVTVNGTFNVNTYHLSFIVDNEELETKNVEYGTSITAPTKDGEGNNITWYTYPATMPAHDLVVYGMVPKPAAPEKYTITYKLDGQTYRTVVVEEGATVSKEKTPYKDGYTFNGWQNEPSTMPGYDVTVNGTFNVNTYHLSFIVDNEELETKNVEYGAAITVPTKDSEGNNITWYTHPMTMPAHDLVVYGMVVKEPEPEVFVWLTIKDGQGTTKMKVKQGLEQVLTIMPEEGWKILSVAMDGTDVTALVMNGGSFTTPAINSDASIIIVYEQEAPSGVRATQSQTNVKVVSDGVVISNAEPETRCIIYSTDGQQVVNTVISEGTRKITLQQGQVYILTIDGRTLKFAL